MVKTEPAYVALTPVILEVADDLASTAPQLTAEIAEQREALFLDTGVRFPGVVIRVSTTLEDGCYRIHLNEIPIARGIALADRYLVSETAERLRARELECVHAIDAVTARKSAWVAEEDRAVLEKEDRLDVRSAAQVVGDHLGSVLRRHGRQFLTIQAVQNMLDALALEAPAAAKSVVPNLVPLLQLTEILGRLVEEDISIRNLPAILQALAEAWRPGMDALKLSEAVRWSMREYVSHRFAHRGLAVIVYLLDPDIEASIRASIKITPDGTHLALEPDVAQEICQAVKDEHDLRPAHAPRPLILTHADIRRYVRKLLEYEFNPPFTVVSYQELSPSASIEPAARISLRS